MRGRPLPSRLDDDARNDLKEFFFLTNKPVMAVLNIGEDQIGDEAAIAAPVRELAGAEVVPLSVQLEAEAAVMAQEDRQEMLEALGLGDGAVPAFLTSAYHMLGLRTYLTTGEKDPCLDLPRWFHCAGGRRRDPHRLPARFHPC